MTAKPYEILIRFNADGTVKGASAKTVTTANGRDYVGDPEPIETSDASFATYATQFSTAAIAERDTAVSERDAAKSERDAAVGERDELKTQLATAKETIATQVKQIEVLQREFDPRKIDPSAWYARFSMDDVLAITELAVADLVAQQFVTALKAAREARKADPIYQMDLDADTTQQGVGYLAAKGAISQETAVAVLADSNESEQ